MWVSIVIGAWESSVNRTEDSCPCEADILAEETDKQIKIHALEGDNYMCERRGGYFIQSGQRKASQGRQPLSR